MLANYLAAALRNLFQNRAYAAINLVGLSVGFTAAILIALYVRDEYSYDRFFPHAERIYQIGELIYPPGSPSIRTSVTTSDIAPAMQLDFPEISMSTRIFRAQALLRIKDGAEMTAGAFWAEPNFFRIFPRKAIAGDSSSALSDPSSIVLTHRAALRFFGRDDVVGKSIELDRKHTMRVSAIIEDWPAHSNFRGGVFLPAVANFSPRAIFDAQPANTLRAENVYSFVRLRAEAHIDRIQAGLRAFADRHVPGEVNGVRYSKFLTFTLTPLTEVHFLPTSLGEMKPPADLRIVHTMIGIAFLILLVAGGNFVSMMTARAAGRATEVGVRKAVGATRRQIMAQFVGECLLYSALSLFLAIGAVTLLLPAFNGFLNRQIAFDYMTDPALGICLLGSWLIVGLAAGAYPALVLSQFRPNAVLKGAVTTPNGRGRIRHALVIFQFATLIGLCVATLTIHRQMQFAIDERLRLPTDQIYIADGCRSAVVAYARQLTGLLAVGCASESALSFGGMSANFLRPGGGTISTRAGAVDYPFFDVFNIKPLAGRLLSPDHGEDDVLRDSGGRSANPSLVINESAAHALGFSTPQAAIGHFMYWSRIEFKPPVYEIKLIDPASSEIVGVVPDFSIASVRNVVEPMVYYFDPNMLHDMALKIDGEMIPDVLRQLGEAWKRQGEPQPFGGVFLSEYINEIYSDIKQESAIFRLFSGIAIVIAALGLLGLALFTAARRTKEIGLRKIMGASRMDIFRFLAWQFTRPVLWANFLAWPCAYWVMRRWLEGFAYHIDQSFLTFISASLLAAAIALATVAGHALLVARARPVDALRYG